MATNAEDVSKLLDGLMSHVMTAYTSRAGKDDQILKSLDELKGRIGIGAASPASAAQMPPAHIDERTHEMLLAMHRKVNELIMLNAFTLQQLPIRRLY